MVNIDDDAAVKAARLPGVTAELAAAATRLHMTAAALAAADRDTGQFGSSFTVEPVPGPKGVTDYIVANDDPGALPIELGHLTPPTKTSPGTWVPGKYTLARAIRAM